MQARYSRQQVEEILSRALRREHGPDGLTHEELLVAAAEVGLSAEQIEQAAEELADDEERARLLERVKRRRRRSFVRRLVSSLGLVGVLAAVDHFLPAVQFWHWVALGLSFPLLRAGIRGYLASDADLERDAQVEAEREAKRRQQARKRKDSRRREQEFRRVVERAADLLLGAADRHLSRIDQDSLDHHDGPADQPAEQSDPPVRARVQGETVRDTDRRDTDRGDREEPAEAARGPRQPRSLE